MTEKRRDLKGRLLFEGESQRTDGRYEYKYRDCDGTRKSVYSWKLVESDRLPKGKRCKESLRTLEAQIKRDVEDGINTAVARRMSLNQLFEQYIGTKYELKQSTRTNYCYMYEKYVQNNIGRMRIDSIKYTDVKRLYVSLIRENGFKPNSMEVIHTVLHPAFEMAVRDGYIRTNPTKNVMSEIKKGFSWEKGKRHALTQKQQTAFMTFVSESDEYRHWLPLFTVFLGTGCRVGEIIGLRWQDCDFENEVISINHNLIYRQQDNGKCERHITTPKTKAGERVIPMLTAVKEALLYEKERQEKCGNNVQSIDGYSGFVFVNRDGNTYIPHSINCAIKRIRRTYNEYEEKNAKMEHREPVLLPDFSVHNLRHTFCTRFCENETNLKVIQEIMGHSDISTTMDVYNEATMDVKKQSFAGLDKKIKIC